MRRTLLAVLFFVALVAIWAALVNAKIWSPVLLPSPRNVVDYLVRAARDGSLLSASTVTLETVARRIFYWSCHRTPSRVADRVADICRRHDRGACSRPANTAEC